MPLQQVCDNCGQNVLVDYSTDRIHPHYLPDTQEDLCPSSGLRSLKEHEYESIVTVNGGLPTLGKDR